MARRLSGFFRRRLHDELRTADIPFVSPVTGAQIVEPAPAAMWAVYLLLAALCAAVAWAASAKVDIVAKANGRVVPDGREQVIASLEGGLLRELMVREGQQVDKGQALAMLDPTRAEAQQAEGQAKQLALRGALARLQAEAVGKPLAFPPGLPAPVVQGESQSFEARKAALQEGIGSVRRSMALLGRELAVAQRMSSKGLMSEVEVMRLRRQINELSAQVQERSNRFRQDANAELVRVRTELAQLEEQMVVRDDTLKRSTLVSPVRGVVKQIKANTLGGVVAPGAPVMEILPLGQHVLVEARVRPADIGFVRVGQPVLIKLSAYEYTIYGGLRGVVHSISPDALGDPDRASSPDGTWYRALVRAQSNSLVPIVGAGALVSGVKGPSEQAATAGAAVPMQAASGSVVPVSRPQLPVLPGMLGSVEIRTGERSVLAYLLLPLLRSNEAFRER